MAYFHRLSDSTFLATEHVGGAWNTAEQHIAPALGLLAHAVELDRDNRRGDGLVLTRLAYDILGTVPVAAVEVAVRVLRPGRTIELVEATLAHAGRVAVTLRAWLLQPRDTAGLQGSALVPIPAPDELPVWDATTMWPGGFIASVEVRRALAEPGRAAYWVRPDQPLLDGEQVSPMARAAGLLDISNGMAARVHPKEVAFPNVDLTAHLFAEPRGEWLGFDTTVSFSADGIGVTSSVLHDRNGPVGTMAQVLTVRPF
ncbi:thioesterase family protein [Jatrophihabitans sp.]|uniref:thioesterase family protein n=1 Tax=Jatrophihabitans sp. TaxID=1932789 RepID=UPI002BE3987C|nr:thioesterase family protein [Jatrophihabitans sp.]